MTSLPGRGLIASPSAEARSTVPLIEIVPSGLCAGTSCAGAETGAENAKRTASARPRMFLRTIEKSSSRLIRVARRLAIEHAHHRVEIQTLTFAARVPVVRRWGLQPL